MKVIYSALIVLIVAYQQQQMSQVIGKPTSKPRQLSFAIPGLSLLPGASVFANSVVTRTVLRTVSTVTVGSVRTCTSVAAALSMTPCPGGRKKRGATDTIPSEIQPTRVLLIGSDRITDQVVISKILDLPYYVIGNDSQLQLPSFNNSIEFEDPTLLPSTTEDELFTTTPDDSETTTNQQTPLADFWHEINEKLGSDSKSEAAAGTIEEDKARLAFGTASTTTVTLSITGVAYSSLSTPIFTVSYAGCLPVSFSYTTSAC